MKGVVPSGGRGTRMRPITFSANKHFIPVANKPLIFYPIECLANAGVKHIFITYNPGYLEIVKQYLGDGSQWGIKLEYVLQAEPVGLANILQVCEEHINGEPFVFHLGDNIFPDGIGHLIDHFDKNKLDGLLATVESEDNTRLGVPYFDKKGHLIKLVEKPKNPPHNLAIPGIYFGNHNFFRMFKGKDQLKPSARGEYEIADAFQWLIDRGYKVETKPLNGDWLDPGKFTDWMDANRYILDRFTDLRIESKPDKLSKIEGRVHISKNVKIENSIIRGPVNLAPGVVINNAFIGPYSSIGQNCQVINSNIQNSIVMNDTKLENIKTPIDGSLIGPNSKIIDDGKDNGSVKFFIGEMSEIQL